MYLKKRSSGTVTTLKFSEMGVPADDDGVRSAGYHAQ